MKKFFIAGLASLFVVLPCRAGKSFPNPPRSYVHNEGVVSPAAADSLSRTLSDFERRTGHQFVVALFQSLEGENLEDYTNRLFKAWEVGNARRNDGLLFAVFKRDRRWRVEVGYGLEGVVTDLEAAELARQYGVPLFYAGDFDSGIEAVVAALAAKISGEASPVRPRFGRQSQPIHEGATEKEFWVQLILIWGLILAFTLLMNKLGARYHLNGGRSSGWDSSGWGGGFSSGGGSWGGGDSGGFSGGGGSSGGGGASGGW